MIAVHIMRSRRQSRKRAGTKETRHDECLVLLRRTFHDRHPHDPKVGEMLPEILCVDGVLLSFILAFVSSTSSGDDMVLAAALLGHALLEGGVGVALLMGSLTMFPEITALKSYVHPHRALVRWFSLSIILQGLLAIAGLWFSRAQQRVLVLLFLSYHIALVLDGGIGYFKESSTDLAASITHGVMAIILSGALLFDRTKTGSVAKTGLSKQT